MGGPCREFVAPPVSPPAYAIPKSSSTVDVRVIDTGTRLILKCGIFWEPDLPNFKGVNAPLYSFLISHNGDHILFDLGVRPDWYNLAPKTVESVKKVTEVTGNHDVATVLESDDIVGVRRADISAIIWSHNHFDHTGDPSTFPTTAKLVVGPGVRDASWPAYPTKADSIVLDTDTAGREVVEISFDDKDERDLRIGRFNAFDYFGDGSFYLLDAPGHAVGHICGLARTTAEPPSFVLLGADACHHPGVIRPTKYLPLPRSIETSLTSGPSSLSSNGKSSIREQNGKSDAEFYSYFSCPGEVMQQLTMDKSANAPFFQLAKGPFLLDFDDGMDTVHKIQELDAREDVLTLLAHDLSIRDRIPLFPERINSWREADIANSTRWLFCADFQNSVPTTEDAEATRPE